MVYLGPNKPYTLFTDASKYALFSVLTQKYNTSVGGKTVSHQHPITYVSGLFQGSHVNWVALTKGDYAIYMSGTKMSFYLADASITLRSDHFTLKRFLQKILT